MLLKQLFHTLLCVSLTGALPTDPSLQRRCPDKYCPLIRQQVYYPTNFTQNNCPSIINPSNNPLQGHFDPGQPKDNEHEFKRSLAQIEKRQRPPNPLCNQIAANNNVQNFPNFIGNTGTITLVAGVTYVFSWAFDTAVEGLELWASPDGNNLDDILDLDPDEPQTAGTWEFTMPGTVGQQLQAHFELFFQTPLGGYLPWPLVQAHIYGQFALFVLLPGAPNELGALVRELING